MLLDPAELTRFESCAVQANACFVERFLMDDVERAVARFGRRGGTEPNDPWHDQVRSIVATNGGNEALAAWHAALQRLLEHRPDALLVESTEGKVDATYQRFVSSLA